MATLTQIELTCDLCGDRKDVQAQTIGLDGKTYEIDLCQKDNEELSRVTADYIAKARKVTAGGGQRRKARAARATSQDSQKATSADSQKPTSPDSKKPTSQDSQKATSQDSKKGTSPGPEKEPKSGRPRPAGKKTASKQSAKAPGPDREKGVLVYGILPEDIEVAEEMPGIGDHPGPLRVVRSDGLAALISELEPSKRLGTPDDRRTYEEILDGAATELPVVPLRFGTVLGSEDAVTDELLAARHDEFAGALEELEGRAQFVVNGRYAGQATTPTREEATRALQEAMQEHCVASAVREPAGERDGIQVAFLMDPSQESDVERVIGKLAQEWEGRIELELLGPTAAYAFVNPPAPEDTAGE